MTLRVVRMRRRMKRSRMRVRLVEVLTPTTMMAKMATEARAMMMEAKDSSNLMKAMRMEMEFENTQEAVISLERISTCHFVCPNDYRSRHKIYFKSDNSSQIESR